jgi:uncharacterized membrane protein
MGKIAAFFRDTILRGLLLFLPILVLWGVFRQAFVALRKIATPIVLLLPNDLFPHTPSNKEAAAVLLLFVGSFVFGLLLRARFIRHGTRWLESRTLDHLPGYSVLRGVVSDTMQPAEASGFRAAMLSLSEGMQRPAYVIEDHGDGTLTVFLPGAPAAFSGMIHVVARDRVTFIDAKIGELAMSIAQYGAGLGALMKRTAPRGRINP